MTRGIDRYHEDMACEPAAPCEPLPPPAKPQLMMSTTEHLFLEGFSRLQQEIGADMAAAGFADDAIVSNPLYTATKLALIITEAAEAIEGDRQGNPMDDHLTDRRTVACELADIVIRTMDLAAVLGIPLGEIIIEKRHYNRGRPKKDNKLY